MLPELLDEDEGATDWRLLLLRPDVEPVLGETLVRPELTVPLLLLRLLLLDELLPTVPVDELRFELVLVLPDDTDDDCRVEELRLLLFTAEDELRLELVRKEEERPELLVLALALELLPPPYERPVL